MLWEQNDEVNKSAFEDLKDDYCYDILRRLPLDDLCALSRTCTRLHSLCGKQFLEKYPSKIMRIDSIQEDGTWVKEPRDEMYIKCFDKSIRNVILNGDGLETKLDVVNEFYKGEKMEGVVKEIHFNDWRRLDGAGIKLVDMLKSAETITIDYAAIVEDPYDGIFKYAPNLKHLTVRNSNFTSTDWLQQRYAKLESLELHSPSLGPDANKIKSLLDTNPNIRRFSLFCTNVDDIVQLMAKNVKIDELFVHFRSGPSGWNIQFNYTMTVLMKLLAVQNVNLHLVVSKADIISQLAFVHLNVVGLQLNVSIDEVLTTMYTFDNLQFLRIAASHLPYAYADLIAKLPNLSQLYIDEIFCDNFETFHQTMLAAIGQLVKLTKISLNGFTDQLTKIDFLAFDQERMELHGAAHLKIFIHPKDFFASFPLKFVEFEMIEIIAAESEPSNYPLFLNYIHGMFGHKAINFNLNNTRIDDGVLNYQHPADTWANWRCSQPDWAVGSGNADDDNWDKPNDASNFQKYPIDDSDDHHAGPSGMSKMVVADDSDWSN
ncbi:uncharacterized protein LOC129570342 [Sitodiplosis mosellana]|uniref:uncharacterized protein LOC129570342 n=1 Tax=Sitodiplosis mosellana TaxID=263140 RepID=UPI002445319B|nr:uncharacterized protein LOC129570342 [Sitodiplosis mosellana]XP_055305887.1 uncharacterized protein LOC129570342 [Sitodiplosis mosellana]XP_055305888.1 uncharacterized protein LOC129570342 [Sitodiplosis mosellana]